MKLYPSLFLRSIVFGCLVAFSLTFNSNAEKQASIEGQPTNLKRPAPGIMFGQTLEAALKTEFFRTFFEGSEMRKTTTKEGLAVVNYEPGEKSIFKGRRSLEITLDSQGIITALSLILDREFLDARPYSGMTCDVAKSFLRAAAPDDDSPKLEPLARAVGNFFVAKPGQDRFPPGYSVFSGKEMESEEDFAFCTLRLRHAQEEKKRVLTIAISVRTNPPSSAVPQGRMLSAKDCEALFLKQTYLPEGFKLTQDSRDQGPDPGDKFYTKLGGMYSGFTVWMASVGKSPFRIVDIRWVFPGEAAAITYLTKSLPALAEGMDAVPAAPKLGDESHMFGPDNKMSRALGLNMPMYSVVFRKGGVVAKIFVAQIGETDAKLEPKFVTALAERITKRNLDLTEAEQKAEAAIPAASQRAGVKSQPVEIDSFSVFTLSYSSGTGLRGMNSSISGSWQPDGKLALKMKYIYDPWDEPLNTEWTAVASPELKDRLLGFVGEQLRMHGHGNKINQKKIPAQDFAILPAQPIKEDEAKRRERFKAEDETEERIRGERINDEMKLERIRDQERTEGVGGASLSITFKEEGAREISVPVFKDDLGQLNHEVYASTRSKLDQERHAQERLVWEQERGQVHKQYERNEERRYEERRMENIRAERLAAQRKQELLEPDRTQQALKRRHN